MKTTEYAPVLIKSCYDMDELMETWNSLCQRQVPEDTKLTVVMSDWYGDPYRRDISVSMTFMDAPVLMEVKDGWRAPEEYNEEPVFPYGSFPGEI